MLSTLLLGLASLLATAPGQGDEYKGVVVDAVTRRPLPSVTVHDVNHKTTLVTSADGSFQLAGPDKGPVQVRLTSIGYVPSDFTRALRPGQSDTLFLTPVAQQLAGVTIRPQREQSLNALGTKYSKAHGFLVIPSVNIATLIPALPNGGTGVLSKVLLQMDSKKIKEGGLRIFLFASPTANPSAVPVGPSLLPEPLIVSAATLAAAPKGLLSLDVSAYKVPMPANGIFVQVEGVASVTENQEFVAMTGPTRGKGTAMVVLASSREDVRSYTASKLNEYPLLESVETEKPSTWFKGSDGRGWTRHNPLKSGRYNTPMVSVVVQTE
jgi:CarboxypepD_reg-like domain